MDEYIGTVQLFAFSWDADGWFKCDGRTLPIQQYAALYSLIGNIYGGEPGKSFALPKLQSPDPNMHYCICWNGYYPSRP